VYSRRLRFCRLAHEDYFLASLTLAPNSDLNTRFSGLTVDDIKGATHDLDATRDELCSIIDENTIIIGHG
jgi:hypothetical protein